MILQIIHITNNCTIKMISKYKKNNKNIKLITKFIIQYKEFLKINSFIEEIIYFFITINHYFIYTK